MAAGALEDNAGTTPASVRPVTTTATGTALNAAQLPGLTALRRHRDERIWANNLPAVPLRTGVSTKRHEMSAKTTVAPTWARTRGMSVVVTVGVVRTMIG
jgi:hypothetical protein